MAHPKTKINIGIDLDGVIIDKPPIIPQKIIEWLYRSHKKRKLEYRFPKKYEQYVRILSHHPLIRPPINTNIALIRKLAEDERYCVFAVSSRYSFLIKRTKQWINHYGINDLFEKIYLNENDDQPHVFKEAMINKLKIDILIDDDKALVNYLKRRFKNLRTVVVDKSNNKLKRFVNS
ncbi:hypothetical protein IPM62_00130 [Candidatus Woesebacteria bacterium]|nr:MAG: hypothetical protein IPM62_00130 [Candidatus Woesebacteria bacterium]